jgi:serine/threonine protein kinase
MIWKGEKEVDEPTIGILKEKAFTDANTLIQESLLQDILRSPTGPSAFLILIHDMLNGLNALHEAQLDHKDLKLSNILFFQETGRFQDIPALNGRLKVADFGASNRIPLWDASKRGILQSTVYTPSFVAPERDWERNQESIPLDQSGDLWAMGLCIWQMLTGDGVTHDGVLIQSDSEEWIWGQLLVLGIPEDGVFENWSDEAKAVVEPIEKAGMLQIYYSPKAKRQNIRELLAMRLPMPGTIGEYLYNNNRKVFDCVARLVSGLLEYDGASRWSARECLNVLHRTLSNMMSEHDFKKLVDSVVPAVAYNVDLPTTIPLDRFKKDRLALSTLFSIRDDTWDEFPDKYHPKHWRFTTWVNGMAIFDRVSVLNSVNSLSTVVNNVVMSNELIVACLWIALKINQSDDYPSAHILENGFRLYFLSDLSAEKIIEQELAVLQLLQFRMFDKNLTDMCTENPENQQAIEKYIMNGDLEALLYSRSCPAVEVGIDEKQEPRLNEYMPMFENRKILNQNNRNILNPNQNTVRLPGIPETRKDLKKSQFFW